MPPALSLPTVYRLLAASASAPVPSAAGGTLFDAIGTLDQDFDRVVTEMAGAYVLGIDAASGRVVRSELRLRLEGTTVEITVAYRADSKAGLTWVPSEMRETYTAVDRKLDCIATYSNIRRLTVTADVRLPKPEQP